VHSFTSHARATAGRGALPEHGTGKEDRLAGSSQADADERGEEDAKTLVELVGRGHLDCHGRDVLLWSRMGEDPEAYHARGLPFKRFSVSLSSLNTVSTDSRHFLGLTVPPILPTDAKRGLEASCVKAAWSSKQKRQGASRKDHPDKIYSK
jgi:hypothetical protein